MADVSVMADNARLSDGHARLGVGAGDHAAIIWPLLCGMAKAKYYLMTADFIDGPTAERIGLVTFCTPQEEVLPKALDIAKRLAGGAQRPHQTLQLVVFGQSDHQLRTPLDHRAEIEGRTGIPAENVAVSA